MDSQTGKPQGSEATMSTDDHSADGALVTASQTPPAEMPALLASLRSVAWARVSPEGRLLAANEGFHYLLRPHEDAGRAIEDDNVAACIVNPPFAQLAASDPQGTVLHRGFITFLDAGGQSRSLVGVIYRHDDCIEIVGEHDVAEQERLLTTVMQLNDELAEQQREVIRTNREVKRRQAALDEEIVRRLAIESDLRQEKDAQAALLEKLSAAQNQLLQAEKMASVGQLAAGVAHEINNPLGFVSSNLTSLGEYFDDLLALIDAYAAADALIARDALLSGDIRRIRDDCDLDFIRSDGATLLAESRDGLDRVKKIVLDLKDFSRVDESGWQPADLQACLDSTLNVARHELKGKAEVLREYGQLPPVFCCPAQLNQVFLNMIVNAAQAMSVPGRLVVRTGTFGEKAWVDIEDSGSGIAREHLARIFEPFFTTKPVGKGTGLGLSLSWSIVKAHGGRIDVDSTLGKGTRFRIWLPIKAQRTEEGDDDRV